MGRKRKYQTEEEYLSESISLIDELDRRQMLMHYADIAEDKFDPMSEN